MQVTKVPCSQVVRYAQKSLADAAGSSSVVAHCPVVRRMGVMTGKNAEAQIHPLLKKHNLILPVEISPLTGGSVEGYPRLKPLDFFTYMIDSGHITRLLGGRTTRSCRSALEDFWKNYQVCHPDFELYDLPEIDLGCCIPIYAHADGGRGFKKSELMVFNWSSAIGKGTGNPNRKQRSMRQFKKSNDSAQVNLLGNSYATHYMWAVMPALWHKDDHFFQEMLLEFGKDLLDCFEGVMVNGQLFRLVLLGLKADLKLQARAGRFTRWYSTCRKGPIDPKNKKQTLGLCCWLCGAGHKDLPFEEVHTEQPAWFQSMDDWISTPPWVNGEECGMLFAALQYSKQPSNFFLPDLFHIYLAGFGQDHAASCLVYMLGTLFQGSSVDKQFDTLNTAWQMWKKMFHVTTHTYTFNRLMLNFTDGTKVFPTGTWSKASDTPKIMEFILYMCSLYEEKVQDDPMLYYIQNSCKAIGLCMKTLYSGDLFLVAWTRMRLL